MTNLNNKLKIAVCGSKGVGKSAVTVRYLTKRFISEYNSSKEHYYKQTIQMDDNTTAEAEILDTCDSNNGINCELIKWADCFLIVYSIIDRKSFYEVEKMLNLLSKIKLPFFYSTIIIGNKCDMKNNRVVTTDEALSLSKSFHSQYAEVSAAEGYLEINSAMQILIKDYRSSFIERNLPTVRRKIGVNSVSKALGNIFGKNSKADRKRPSLSI